MAWKKLCRPKAKGGLGFTDMKMFNWTLLAKQGCLIEQVLKARYYPNTTFMEADLGSLPSYT